jgi:hypothetical protein
VRYRDAVAATPAFERSIDARTLGGHGIMGGGELVLDNTDGALDFLLDVIIDGRDVSSYLGHVGDPELSDPPWARSDFRLTNVAAVESVSAPNDSTISISLKSKGYLLDDTIIGSPIPTGPNAGKPKPILLGIVKNFDITPYMLDSATLTYYFNDFAVNSGTAFEAFSFVRDEGVSLVNIRLFLFSSATMTADAGTDTLTRTTAHTLSADDVLVFVASGAGSLFAGLSANTQYWVLASGLTANDFKLSLTKGGAAVDITGTVMTGSWQCDRRRFYVDAAAATIQLSSSPAGPVTMDLAVIDVGGVMPKQEPHAVMKFLLQNYSNLSASEYDSTAIDALTAIENATTVIYFGEAILDRRNLMDVFDQIAQMSCSWYGLRDAHLSALRALGGQELPRDLREAARDRPRCRPRARAPGDARLHHRESLKHGRLPSHRCQLHRQRPRVGPRRPAGGEHSYPVTNLQSISAGIRGARPRSPRR